MSVSLMTDRLDRDVAYHIDGMPGDDTQHWRWRGTAEGVVMFVGERGQRASLEAGRLYHMGPGLLRYMSD